MTSSRNLRGDRGNQVDNFTNEAFMLVDPKSVKEIDNLAVIFMHLGSARKM